MRGQLSIEYLVLSALALSLLAVSVAALSGIRGLSERAASAIVLRDEAVFLADTFNEVCALGGGNGRKVSLARPVQVESQAAADGWRVRFSDGERSLVRRTYCEVEDGPLEKKVYVENEGGIISIKGR
ncbi:MAG: hypothetical protein U0R44_03595 [Candidatus Micrarchaeia archaeon]